MKSGFVTIIGRPNAGKSTLLNALVGSKIAIVTHKPQTTRNRVQGIINLPAKKGRPGAQVILIDTPGVHKPDTRLNHRMMQEVREGLEGSDLVLLITDVTEKFGPGEQFVVNMAKKTETPTILLLNKIDRIPQKDRLLFIIDRWRHLHEFADVIPISALKRDHLDVVLDTVVKHLPDGPAYFPSDQITDQPLRFLVAELIREQVLLHMDQEIPYASTVIVERYEEEPKLVRIAAAIYCERESQKPILIGKGGQMLKQIGTAARKDIEAMLGKKIFLEMFVKVHPMWRESRHFVEEMDWRRQVESMIPAMPAEEES
jgi:GTP-binding protein Era